MFTRLLGAALLVLFIVPMAHSQCEPVHKFYLGPQVSFFDNDDPDDEFQPFPGAVFRFRVMNAIALEASANYRQENFNDDELLVRTWPVQASALLYPFNTLYGAVGVGLYNTTLDYRNVDDPALTDRTDNAIGWNVGGGVEVPLGTRATLVGDARYHFLDHEFTLPDDATHLDTEFVTITGSLLVGF